MRIALATPRPASNLDEGLAKVRQFISEAASRDAVIVCFPEAYLPGLRGQDCPVFDYDEDAQERTLTTTAEAARTFGIAVIMGAERLTGAGREIAAYVFDAHGALLGCQTKVQIDPSEEPYYVAGSGRQLLEVNGVKFGIAICHEGFRYPETVRWAAARGAKIVFHPQQTGTEKKGVRLTQWGAADSPYYEQAMKMRSRENTIYFASANYALRYQESATSIIAPDGELHAFLPYGEEGVLVADLDIEAATGLLASRYAPERYHERALDS